MAVGFNGVKSSWHGVAGCQVLAERAGPSTLGGMHTAGRSTRLLRSAGFNPVTGLVDGAMAMPSNIDLLCSANPKCDSALEQHGALRLEARTVR